MNNPQLFAAVQQKMNLLPNLAHFLFPPFTVLGMAMVQHITKDISRTSLSRKSYRPLECQSPY